VLLSVDVTAYLPYDLLVKMDIATMASSLEARSPFLDRELMEFAARLPASAKARFGRRKRILTSAYRDRIPREILHGPKRGFAVPLDSWFRTDLREYVRDVLLSSDSLTTGYLAGDKIEAMIDEHVAGRADRSGKLWSLLMLELWHRELGKSKPELAGSAAR
jgi:asparagine synthase (glutamine-hydrolysing)